MREIRVVVTMEKCCGEKHAKKRLKLSEKPRAEIEERTKLRSLKAS